MENFKNMEERWVNVDFDPGRRYSVPWQWGTTGTYALKNVYSGDINTSDIFLNVPPELVGKINVVPEMNDVVSMAVMWAGGEPCTEDTEVEGVMVPAGVRVDLCLGAANHDPEAFENPDAFYVSRKAVPHIGFGGGSHICIGAPARDDVLAHPGSAAIALDAPQLLALRAGIAEHFHGSLTSQDLHEPRPHITIQNKVTKDEARALQASLGPLLVPWIAKGAFAFPALELWRYRCGPWERVKSCALRGR